jgi:cell division protein FtsQ
VNTKISIRKILIVLGFMAASTGLVVLLLAANRKEQKHLCKDVRITIKSVSDVFYIYKGDIITILKNGSNKKLIGQPLNEMNLGRMEQLLEKSSWVRDAELYFDSHDVLHITAIEREPIARVFSTAGTSFYIDSAAKRLPLLQKMSLRVPVVTDLPWSKKMNGRDSALVKEIKDLVLFVRNDSFWNAQVAQIDVVNGKSFEIIPTIGNHVIRIGNGENLEEKFGRLFLFYKKVLSKTGFDHYSIVDVQFDGQVVATQRGTTSKVDSIQLQKNIKELILQAQKAQEAQQPMDIDSTKEAVFVNAQNINGDTTAKNVEKPIPVKPSNTTKTATTKPSPTLKKTTAKPKTKDEKKPKAVMKRVN